MIEDPLVEVAYDELPEGDKGEMRDLKDELLKRRARRQCADTKVENIKRKCGNKLPRRKQRKLAVAEAQGPPVAVEPPVAAGPPAAAGPPVATEDPQPLEPPQGPAVPEPPPAPEPPVLEYMKHIKKGVPWGRAWVIADTDKYGQLTAKTATCLLHRCDGLRCNKWVTISDALDADGAEHRLKEWAIRGKAIDDLPGGRERHMLVSLVYVPISTNWAYHVTPRNLVTPTPWMGM